MYEISCEMCMDLIPLVRDGIASADSCRSVEAHTAHCAGCAAAFGGAAVPPDDGDAALKKAMRRIRNVTAAVLAAFLIFCTVSIAMVFGELSVMYILLVLGMAGLLRFAFGAVKAGKGKKLAALIGGLLLAAALVFIGDMLAGNPVSWLLAKNAVEDYLAQTYAGTDYEAERVTFSFKDGDYYAPIVSQSSIDTRFTVYITKWGQVKYDTFDTVTSGWSTARRLESDYRELTDPVLKRMNLYCSVYIGFGSLEFADREYLAEYEYPWAICVDELELDGVYDLSELGGRAGRLVLTVEDEQVSAERAAELLLQLRSMMDEAGLQFYIIDFTLYHPRPEDGSARPEGRIEVGDFLYTDIYEDGLAERIQQAHEEWEARYEEE